MQTQLFPKEIIENTSETYLAKVSIRSQVIYMSVLAFLISVLIALPFIKVDVSIRTQGITRTILEKSELKSIVSGTVDSVIVTDNQQVKQNDILFTLDTKKIDKQISLVKSQQAQHQELIQDLEKLKKVKNFEQSIQLSSALYTNQFNQLYLTLLEKRSQLKKAIQDLDRAQTLFDEKVIPETELEEAQFMFDKIRAEQRTIIATQRSTWSAELNNFKTNYEELLIQEAQLRQEKTWYQIKAPTSGVFQLTSAKYEGSQIQVGEMIGIVSPDTTLIAECYLSPRDIGLVRQNMKAKFQVDAFNYNEWGFVEGEIIDIAKDFVLIENQPVFKVKCKLKSTSLSLQNGITSNLKKGMTLQGRFVIAERSLFQLLYDEIDDWINPTTNP